MKKLLYLPAIVVLVLCSCKSNITEEKVRKAAARSNEINRLYITDQRNTYVKTLEERIEALENDLEKLRGVSAEGKRGAGANIESSLQQLAAEKATLEGNLRRLHEKTLAAERQMDIHYSRYNYALDSMLKDMDNFMAGYKTEYPGAK